MATTNADTTGNWNVAGNWTNGVPTSSDDATIDSGVTISGNAAMACNTLNILGTLETQTQNLTVTSGTSIGDPGILDCSGSTVSLGSGMVGDGSDDRTGWGLNMNASNGQLKGFYATSLTIGSLHQNWDGSIKIQLTSGSKTIINGYNEKSQNGSNLKWMVNNPDGFWDIVPSVEGVGGGRLELQPPTGDTNYGILNHDAEGGFECLGELTVNGSTTGAVINIISGSPDSAPYDDFIVRGNVYVSGTGQTLKATRPWGSQTSTGYLREVQFGAVEISDGNTLDMSDLGPQDDSYGGASFKSLWAQTNSTYLASSGTTIIRGKTTGNGSQYALRFGTAGTITHNNGTHLCTGEDFGVSDAAGAGTTIRLETKPHMGYLYNVILSSSATNTGDFYYPYWANGTVIAGDLTFVSGSHRMWAGGMTVNGDMTIYDKAVWTNNDGAGSKYGNLTVDGDVLVSGTMNMSYLNTGTTVKSMTVEGGTFSATPGTTTITGRSDSFGHTDSWQVYGDGAAFIANSGSVYFNGAGDMPVRNYYGKGNFYNLYIDNSSGDVAAYGEALTIDNDIIVYDTKDNHDLRFSADGIINVGGNVEIVSGTLCNQTAHTGTINVSGNFMLSDPAAKFGRDFDNTSDLTVNIYGNLINNGGEIV